MSYWYNTHIDTIIEAWANFREELKNNTLNKNEQIDKIAKYWADLPFGRRSIDYYNPSSICIAQSNIRQTTFKINDKDIEKSINGENCIIIELEEC